MNDEFKTAAQRVADHIEVASLTNNTNREHSERLAKAIGQIEEAEKDSYNAHNRYYFASADSVFKAVRQAIADAGLSLVIKEKKAEVKVMDLGRGEKPFYEVAYTISMDYGATEEDVYMLVPYLGPQSMQAARTFAVKYYLRSKLLVPTGERDIDHESNEFDDKGTSAIEFADEQAKEKSDKTSDAIDAVNEMISKQTGAK